MQREIKFRGKRVDGQGWVYGTYHYSADGKYHYILAREKFIDLEGMPVRYLHKPEVWEVLPESVGQYTGLNDIMTTNGFEHDVIERDASDGKGKVRGVIYFEEGQFRVKWLDNNKGWNNSLYLHLEDSEIIGNTIDNPELIKP